MNGASRRCFSAAVSKGWTIALLVTCSVFACNDDAELPRGTDGGAAQADGGRGGGGTGGGGAGDARGGEDSDPAVCGDGIRSGAEACDDGNIARDDGCDADCHVEETEGSCGDGAVSDTEVCDDGNLSPGDGCDASCRTERCGNSRLDAGEECDPPRAGACTAACINFGKSCGDGRVQAGELEECDDRNRTPGDGCHDCRIECGDGRIDAAIDEECEPEYSERCSDRCEWLPACGDGEIQHEAGEECDPSNGVTCVDCKRSEPPSPPSCDGGAGGAGGGAGPGASGQGGDCSSSTPCVPSVGAGVELLQNGNFDSNSAAWEALTPLVGFRTVDEGSPEPQALEVAIADGPVRALAGPSQCVPIRPGALYEIVAQYRIQSGAPGGVAASVSAFLYGGTRCSGAFAQPPISGPAGSVREAWTPYQLVVDTSALAGTADARLLLRLNVVRPANVSGSRVLWDSVSFQERGSTCGNCNVDERETCDDGNHSAGDGCSPSCGVERCGDGVPVPGEQCDDGNQVFGGAGDRCLPSCRAPNACDDCAALACGREMDTCLALEGVASGGPAAGTPRSVLCSRLRDCVGASACDRIDRNTNGAQGAFLENCYCGSASTGCFARPSTANGSCRAEVEAALETTSPVTLAQRLDGSNEDYPLFAAVESLRACEIAGCSSTCAVPPSCGDGRVQDRNFDFTFTIDRQEVPCRDDLTHTRRGCSFEECDDGNEAPGDGCDEHCFVEACGNYVVQADEECDDGNTSSGDGCDAECRAEYDCGDGTVQTPFEECDPPESGGGRLCSKAEYETNPAQCGCDAECTRTVCGNGVVQRPAEQCDPPNAISCGDDCRSLDQGFCETCINENPDLEPVNTLCNDDAACIAVKRCVLDSGCFLPVNAACYCGDDIDECESATFVPEGPCVEEILAGFGGLRPSNAEVIESLFNFDYATGKAMLVLDEATRVCTTECFP